MGAAVHHRRIRTERRPIQSRRRGNRAAGWVLVWILPVRTDGQRELLSDNTEWQATTDGATPPSPPFSADTSLSRSVLNANVASDFNGDGINDTANSAFRVFGGGTDLSFALRQRITAVSSSVAFMQQNYTITNNGTQPISLVMVRSFDGDLLWTGDFSTDSVGTTSNGDPDGKSVFMQEVGQPAQSVNLSMGLQGNAYFGGKNGVDPDGAGGSPAYNFGSDTEIWESIGMPGGWVNNIAGVGYNTNGQSGATPAGSVSAARWVHGLGHPAQHPRRRKFRVQRPAYVRPDEPRADPGARSSGSARTRRASNNAPA